MMDRQLALFSFLCIIFSIDQAEAAGQGLRLKDGIYVMSDVACNEGALYAMQHYSADHLTFGADEPTCTVTSSEQSRNHRIMQLDCTVLKDGSRFAAIADITIQTQKRYIMRFSQVDEHMTPPPTQYRWCAKSFGEWQSMSRSK